uniref:39S ribosomal protein L33, mitochondrial n=1 Tax=Parastrongyloides trichosuri TaxID=131310 RepID=A0A0N4Z7A4_PARTI
MAPKSKYVIVQLASVISGTTRVWVRERAAAKYSGTFFDPAIGKNALFEEVQRIKGKSELSKTVKKMFGIS